MGNYVLYGNIGCGNRKSGRDLPKIEPILKWNNAEPTKVRHIYQKKNKLSHEWRILKVLSIENNIDIVSVSKCFYYKICY